MKRRENSFTIVLSIWMILQILQTNSEAGPVKRSSRMIREVYPEIEPEKLGTNQAEVCVVGDVVYSTDEMVPADQPCLKCKCQPPGVQCEITRCPKKPGCRAIHKPNKCCPDYQCECHHEGRTYGNGERLQTPPGGECRVCYCRGGEVQCADVSCYIRTDCEGRKVPGQCCPKYDHCPPKEPLFDRASYTTEATLMSSNPEISSLSSLQVNASADDTSTQTTASYEINEFTPLDNKIGESLKESENFTPEKIAIPLTESTATGNKVRVYDLVDASTQTDQEIPKKEFISEIKNVPRITIHEIIPDVPMEIPMTGPPKREINKEVHKQNLSQQTPTKVIDKVSEIVKESEKELISQLSEDNDSENAVNDLIAADSDSDSSEIAEIYHHPPPVLKIGDKLLFLKKGELIPEKDASTPSPVITVIGAEGLQRGTEDSIEIHEPIFYQPDEINTEHSELLHDTNTPAPDVPGDNITTNQTDDSIGLVQLDLLEGYLTTEENYSAESSTDTLGSSEDIINRIKTLTNMESTTSVADLVKLGDTNETFDILNSTNSDELLSSDNNVWEDIKSTKEPNIDTTSENHEFLTSEESSSEQQNVTQEATTEVTPTSSVNFLVDSNVTDTNETKKLPEEKDDIILMDQNPEYPPIPDFMSPQNIDELTEHIDAELAHLKSTSGSVVSEKIEVAEHLSLHQNKILPEVLEIRNNHTLKNESKGEHSEWLKGDGKKTLSVLPEFILNQETSSDETVENPDQESEDNTENDLLHEASVLYTTYMSTEKPTNSNGEKLNQSENRSGESFEETTIEDSGESTTSTNSRIGMLSIEDASIEAIQNDSPEFGTKVVEMLQGYESLAKENGNKTQKAEPMPEDAEIIDLDNTDPKITIQSKSIVNQKKEEAKTKFELPKNNSDKETENIFKELNEDLNGDKEERRQTPENAKEEAESIFRELLDDITSTTTQRSNKVPTAGRDKESEVMQRVSDAIAKFQLKKTAESLDSSILGILREFFSSQYKYYQNK